MRFRPLLLFTLAAGLVAPIAQSASPEPPAPKDPVIFKTGFESPEWFEEWGLAEAPANCLTGDLDPDRKFAMLEGKALRVATPAGGHYGVGGLSFDFRKMTGSEPEEVYFRYYLRFADDWCSEGGKLPGISGTYNTAGWGGRPSHGSDGWSARGTMSRIRDDGRVPVGFYCYHADMKGQYGNVWIWEKDGLGYLEKNRWYCIEQYCRMNTPGENDGVLRAWVDGGLAFEKTDIRFRDVEKLKIEKVWMNVYHGGTNPAKSTHHLYIDGVVISKAPIGPRK